MSLNGLLDPLWFNADVTLRCGGAGVLQEPLNKDNVISVGFINLRGVPLPEAVGADSIVSQIVTDDAQLLLNCPLCDWEDDVCGLDVVTQAVVLNILPDDQLVSEAMGVDKTTDEPADL
jgi:hypothetical protein